MTFIFTIFLEACCSRYLGDYIPTNVFPLHVYFGRMAGYFERKEEKTDCRGSRVALYLTGQRITKITRLYGREHRFISFAHFLKFQQDNIPIAFRRSAQGQKNNKEKL